MSRSALPIQAISLICPCYLNFHVIQDKIVNYHSINVYPYPIMNIGHGLGITPRVLSKRSNEPSILAIRFLKSNSVNFACLKGLVPFGYLTLDTIVRVCIIGNVDLFLPRRARHAPLIYVLVPLGDDVRFAYHGRVLRDRQLSCSFSVAHGVALNLSQRRGT